MRIVGKEMTLPPMDSNPFSTVSLEASDSDLLVGRNHMLTVLSQYMKFRSPRRILLLGEHGSGRTSLLRCASKTAPLSIYIDHISHSQAGLNLLKEIYAQFVHMNPPENRSELIDQIMAATHNFPHALPLIVLDASTVDISALNVALRDTLPLLERLHAVVVVVVETKDKNMLPASILQRLEQMNPLPNLAAEEIQLLVERRIEKSTNQTFSFALEDAQHLLEQTNGLPAEVIRVMRDAIDSSKMSQYTYVDPQYDSKTPVSESQFAPTAIEPHIHSSFESVFNDEQEPSIEPLSALIEEPTQTLEEVQDAKIMESIEDINNIFDLNLDQLTVDQENQEALKELEAVENYRDGYPATPPKAKPEPMQRPPLDPIATKGMTGLFTRNREYTDLSYAEVSSTEEFEDELVDFAEGAELWEDPSLRPSEPIEEVISADESAFMLHDEIGLFEHEEPDFAPIEPAEEPVSLPIENIEQVVLPSTGLLSELAGMVPVMKALQNALQTSDGLDTGVNRRKLVDALESLQRKPVGVKQDYALNPSLLSTLTGHEMVIISIANDRRYSPSDEEILGQLNIKRARLSQISNRLLKGGVLSVRTLGRNRYYELTQAARAQLIAWNVLGGDV
ncbi:MAG: hypothetical protein HOI85_01305 [Euryarchaeota archaeon]|nr:hypothetical protein [Euryarchaeota archaeon]